MNTRLEYNERTILTHTVDDSDEESTRKTGKKLLTMKWSFLETQGSDANLQKIENHLTTSWLFETRIKKNY